MYLEVHVLQNFALSNLNRDDTGAPKTCDFGGVRRARISSQCVKRAVRTYFRAESLLPVADLGYRTKLLKAALSDRLGRGDQAEVLAGSVVTHLGLGLKKERTEYLLFIGAREIDRLATLAAEHQGPLLRAAQDGKVDKTVQAALLDALDGGGAVDVALFGRMIADKPDHNVDAAVQVAHAFSTHAVSTEFDFFSAVDDLQREDDDAGLGAGMLGTTLYNSSCYYRYANLDRRQLGENLAEHSTRAADAVRAFLRGTILAVPSGKQTGSAAQNPPALVMAVVRDKGLWSLANAFVKPVRPKPDEDVVHLSAEALTRHFGQLSRMYGHDGIRYVGATTYLDLGDGQVPGDAVDSVDTLIDRTVAALEAGQGSA